jgi:hypothetical protein
LRKFLERLNLEKINLEKINLYLITSFFFVTLSYFISKAFFGFGEFSDNLFVISIPIFCEISLLLMIATNYGALLKSKIDYIAFFLSFIIIFLLWDNNSYIYKNILLFLVLNFLTLGSIIFFNKINNKNEILIISFFLIILNSLFIKIDYLKTENIFLIFLIYFICFTSFKLKFKNNNVINKILSLLSFIILFKVFILSSEKDSFHYSYIIGSGYSTLFGHELLNEVVSQYGYLNILLVDFFSNFTAKRVDVSIILLIISLLIIFFILLFKKIKKVIDYPVFFSVIFVGIILFANMGVEKLTGSILIPSSSVFRFLPAIIVMSFLSKIILFKSKNNLIKNIYLFFFFLTTGSLWSFESFFFIFFSLLVSLLFFMVIFIPNKNKILQYMYTHYRFVFFQTIILSLIFLLIIFFIFKNNQIIFFYEYVLNGNSIKNVDIPNSRYVLIFIIFLIIKYLFLRSAFKFENFKYFFNNLIWFTLFVSFSAYYVTRSVYTNLFALLPFYTYFLLSMQSENETIRKVRKFFFDVFFLMSLAAFFLSCYINKDIFYKNLFTLEYLNLPKYDYNDYKPSSEVQSILDKFEDIPVTLYTGKTVHNYNKILFKGGYGLPILPLEQFNILSINRKIQLMDVFFEKNDQHLILCLKKCSFYSETNKMKSWSSIFVPVKYKILKLNPESKSNEVLYLIKK